MSSQTLLHAFCPHLTADRLVLGPRIASSKRCRYTQLPTLIGYVPDSYSIVRVAHITELTCLSVPGTSAVSQLHPATSFEDFLNADDDDAFVADLSRSDGSPNTSLESGADFLSELFFDEEDSGSSSQAFDPDFLNEDARDLFVDGPSPTLVTECGYSAISIYLTLDSRSMATGIPEDVTPPPPVRYDIVCEHAYKSPTLLTRRLKYLRQMQ